MNPDYQSYTEAELLDVCENIDKEAWPERYNEVKKHLQKFSDEAKENAKNGTDKNEASEESWWRKIDFNKPQEKVITIALTLWTLYISFTGKISAKNSEITFDESPKMYLFFVAFTGIILFWRIYRHVTSHNKKINKD